MKWLQKNGLVYLSNLCIVEFYSWMCRWPAHFRKVALQTAHFGNFLNLYSMNMHLKEVEVKRDAGLVVLCTGWMRALHYLVSPLQYVTVYSISYTSIGEEWLEARFLAVPKHLVSTLSISCYGWDCEWTHGYEVLSFHLWMTILVLLVRRLWIKSKCFYSALYMVRSTWIPVCWQRLRVGSRCRCFRFHLTLFYRAVPLIRHLTQCCNFTSRSLIKLHQLPQISS